VGAESYRKKYDPNRFCSPISFILVRDCPPNQIVRFFYYDESSPKPEQTPLFTEIVRVALFPGCPKLLGLYKPQNNRCALEALARCGLYLLDTCGKSVDDFVGEVRGLPVEGKVPPLVFLLSSVYERYAPGVRASGLTVLNRDRDHIPFPRTNAECFRRGLAKCLDQTGVLCVSSRELAEALGCSPK
jgi:hypothetical protein